MKIVSPVTGSADQAYMPGQLLKCFSRLPAYAQKMGCAPHEAVLASIGHPDRSGMTASPFSASATPRSAWMSVTLVQPDALSAA